MQYNTTREVYFGECMGNEVCKLFARIDETVTQAHQKSLRKNKKISNDYWENN